MQPALLSLGYSINTQDPAQIEEAKNLTIEAKEHLLQFDDTEFYEKLDYGEASMVHAWDGWCNYATNKNVEFVVPSEGSDVFADTMVITEASREQGGGARVHQLRAGAREPRQGGRARAVQGAERAGDGAARPEAGGGLPEPRDPAGRTARVRDRARPRADAQTDWSQAVAEIKAS